MAAAPTDGAERDSASSRPRSKAPFEGEAEEEGLEGTANAEPGLEDVEEPMAVEDGLKGGVEENAQPPVTPGTTEAARDAAATGDSNDEEEEEPEAVEEEEEEEAAESPQQQSPASSGGEPADGPDKQPEKEAKAEQRDDGESVSSDCGKLSDGGAAERSGAAGSEHGSARSDHGDKRRSSVEISSSSDGEPLSRMDSEDSISSTLMDMESTASSGRSTPAMMNGQGSATPSSGKGVAYTCCWDQCLVQFSSSPDLAEHIRGTHVDGQRGGVFVCLWKGCKVYNTPSTSQSWLQRHMLTHSGDKPFKCVVGGCNASFASQGGLARHVPTHFSQQNSSKVSSQAKVKEESPSKAGINKRRKLRNKRRRSLPRPHDFFDAQTMDAIRHRAICLNLATHIESLGNGHSVVFHSTVIARRKEDSGKVKVLLHWTPEDILPDAWVNETERPQLKTKVVHLSQLPHDTAVLLDPNIYRTLPQKRLKRRFVTKGF
ncbi:zinc finger protein aebp2-like [Arapaima gigas]